MKLLAPDMEEMNALVKKYMQQGNKEASKIERNKIKQLRRSHGIYPFFSLINIF
jgi:hypothetical protein